MDAIECLKTRRCIRSYRAEDIDRKTLEDIVDCGRLAASAINIQPWRFIVVTEQDMLERIANATDYGKFISGAAACIVVFCEKVKYYIEDGSAATQNLLLAAHAHGLASCWVAGDKKDYCSQIREILSVPENLTLVSLVPLGYSDRSSSPNKKPLSEVMSWERYSE